MFEFLLHAFPVAFAVASFWTNTERKLLLLNLGLCLAIGSLLVCEQAWGGRYCYSCGRIQYKLSPYKTKVAFAVCNLYFAGVDDVYCIERK